MKKNREGTEIGMSVKSYSVPSHPSCFSLGVFRLGFSGFEAVLELPLVDQAELKLRDPPASSSPVLGLKVCPSTAQPPPSILTGNTEEKAQW